MSVALDPTQAPGEEGALQQGVATVDALIITLIALRRTLSAEVARTRLRSGLVQTSLSWENKVIGSFSEGLGQQGVRVALLLLGMSRIDGQG